MDGKPDDMDLFITQLRARIDGLIAECQILRGLRPCQPEPPPPPPDARGRRRRRKRMHGEQGVRTGKRELHSRAERDRQTRLAARTQPQAEVFAHAAAPDGEARSRFSGQSGPINPNIIGAAAPLPAPAEKPLPPDLQRLHERKIAVNLDPDPAAVEAPRSPGRARPVETCDGQEPYLRFETCADAEKALLLAPTTISNAVRKNHAAGGRRWRDVAPATPPAGASPATGRRRGVLRPVETCDGQEPQLRFKSLTDALAVMGPDATMSALNYAIASGKSYRGRRWRDARPEARVAS